MVEVWVRDVEGMYGADVALTFDPAVLEVVDADPSSAGVQIQDGGFLNSPKFYVARIADNTTGVIQYIATSLNPAPVTNGSGVLFRVQFRAQGAGSSALHFTNVQLSGVGEPIASTPFDGTADTATPASPSLAISAVAGTTARLSWAAASGAAEYRLYRDLNPYFTPSDLAYQTTTALSYDDAGAVGDPAENHFYVVKSACGNGFTGAGSNRVGEFDFSLVPGSSG